MVIGIIAAVAAILSAGICVCTGAFDDLSWLWLLPVGWLGSFLAAILLIFLVLLAMCACVDLQKEQREDNRLYRRMVYLVADAAHTVLRIRVNATGVEKIPEHGRVFLVCNHLNDLDPVVIFHQVKKRQQLAFIAKREVGEMFMVGKFMHRLLCQRINRENDREALQTILRCIEIIREDQASIAVFPEGGTRTVLHPFRNGVFKIPQRTRVPIVVCTLWGSQDILKNGLKPVHVDFHVVGVVQPEEYAGMNATQIGELVHGMMARDLGPGKVLD